MTKFERYEPDYDSKCEVCGQSPVVTLVLKGKVVHSTDMCGCCTWGEAACHDPDEWNKPVEARQDDSKK